MKGQVVMHINVYREVTEVRIVPVVVSYPVAKAPDITEGCDSRQSHPEGVYLFVEREPCEHPDSYAPRQFAQEANLSL